MFEPVHGAGFDITGKGIANPIATFFAVSMMMEHLGEKEVASQLNSAIINNLTSRKIMTPDLGGSSSTSEVGDDIISLMK
jgi:tartrate dehydrogenase/decarboxylase/D-malate dehydrogenase